MKVRHIFTGSAEIEAIISLFLSAVDSIDEPAPKTLFDGHEYHYKVMTEGRNGSNDAHPGSTAIDDTGGFFIERENNVYLTDKAKKCIRVIHPSMNDQTIKLKECPICKGLVVWCDQIAKVDEPEHECHLLECLGRCKCLFDLLGDDDDAETFDEIKKIVAARFNDREPK